MQPQLEKHVANNLAGATTVPRFDAEAMRTARRAVPLNRPSFTRFNASPSRALLFVASHPKTLALIMTLALASGIGIGAQLNAYQPQEARSIPDVMSEPSLAPTPTVTYQPTLPPVVPSQLKAVKVEDDVGNHRLNQPDKGFKQGLKKVGKGAFKILKWPVKKK